MLGSAPAPAPQGQAAPTTLLLPPCLCHKLEPAAQPCPPSPLPQVLRLALYELEFKGLAPHALDEHVELARRVCQASGQGYVPAFANGVLREAGRRAEAGALPTPQVRMTQTGCCGRRGKRGAALQTGCCTNGAFANGVLREAGRRAEAGALPTPQVRMGARWCGVRVRVCVCV